MVLNINYIKDSEDKFDLEIINGDLKLVDGEDSIKIDIINAVLTRLGELEHLCAFQKLGSKVYSIPKRQNTEMSKFLLKEYIRESVTDLPTIKYVETIQILEDNVNIVVVDNNDQTLNIKI